MDQDKYKKTNSLIIFRRRMGLSQKSVSKLLGHSNNTLLSGYERGRYLPPLATALRLSIILRIPVEFLFPALYDALRNHIRETEENLS